MHGQSKPILRHEEMSSWFWFGLYIVLFLNFDRFSSVIMGIDNTICNITGLLAPIITGQLASNVSAVLLISLFSHIKGKPFKIQCMFHLAMVTILHNY